MKLFTLSLFATLVATANPSRTCDCSVGMEGCFKNGTCTTEKGECIQIAFNNTIAGTMVTSHQYKGCQESSALFDPCSEKIIFITAGKSFYLNSETKCCKVDRCNKDNISVPTEDNKISSWGCPSCFALGNETCNATMKKCVKSQDQCVHIIGSIRWESETRDFVLKGCATSSTVSILQEKGAKLNFGKVTYSIAKTTARLANGKDSIIRAPRSIVFAVFLPSLLVLLLDKFLY